MVISGSCDTSSSSEQQPINNEPKYKGVRKRKWGKWVSEIRLPNSRERIWLGSYDTPEKAARAFDAASYCLRGRSASLNFPENIPPVDVAGRRSLQRHEIQAVAQRFANEEPPSRRERGESSTSGAMEQQYTSSSTAGAVYVDSDTAIDWSFLSALDNNNNNNANVGSGASDFGLFSDLGNLGGGDYYPPPPSPPPMTDDQDDNPDEAYLQHSFLWNF